MKAGGLNSFVPILLSIRSLLVKQVRYSFAYYSNTIMIGELPPSPDRWFGWWYAGYGQVGTSSLDSLMGVRERNIGSRSNSICGSGPFSFRPGHSEIQCSSLHYWSQHPGGAQFVLADGCQKFMPYDSAEILPALASRNGSEVFEMP
jgi:hypothetical protein